MGMRDRFSEALRARDHSKCSMYFEQGCNAHFPGGCEIVSAVAVIGLGRVGLALATQFASSGHQVIGVDRSLDTVQSVNSGCSRNVSEKDLDRMVYSAVGAGRLHATSDLEFAVKESTAVIVVLPLPTNEFNADFVNMDNVVKRIGRALQIGTLVVLESIIPAGTTRGRFRPLLEQFSEMEAGRDFALCFSPERTMIGRTFEDLLRYPKLIGGLTEECGRRAARLYDSRKRPVLDCGDTSSAALIMKSLEAAEMVKLVDSVYGDVNRSSK